MGLHPLTTSDILFPSASTNIAKTTSLLSRSSLSIRNRLHSIASDSAFVSDLAAEYALPVVSNERCGSWYVEPSVKAGSCYFKSTDGHTGEWGFSLRRLNLQVLDLAGRGDGAGCIVVDSTRRGKHLPDALSKTIPIWCAVVNRLLFPELPASHGLERLAELVSESEHAQIEARLEGFVEQALKLDLAISTLRSKVSAPMKPIWIARSLQLPKPQDTERSAEPHTPIYLCMASTYQDTSHHEFSTGYVQGAGDDNEAWSRGLTSAAFWKYREELLAAREDDLPALIELVLERGAGVEEVDVCEMVKPAVWLGVGAVILGMEELEENALLIVCAPEISGRWQEGVKKRILHLKCGVGKLGSRDLRKELVKVPLFFGQRGLREDTKVFVRGQSGKDLAVGVALALLCLYTDERGSLLQQQTNFDIDKDVIRRKLSWIMASIPSASPSRATLNAVNSFLMNRPG